MPPAAPDALSVIHIAKVLQKGICTLTTILNITQKRGTQKDKTLMKRYHLHGQKATSSAIKKNVKKFMASFIEE